MSNRLKIRLHGVHVADLKQSPRTGRLSLRYVKSWLDNPAAYALSLRLPLKASAYDDDYAAPFIAGLLPDSKLHRRLIGEALGIGDTSEFRLLEAIGRECAGAVSVVPEDEPDAPELSIVPHFDLLDERQLAELIRNLPRRPLMIDQEDDVRLSLAGVNDKAAVVRSGGRIGLPKGNTPSTHILKTDIPRLPDSVRTENFCLKLAREVGIRTPRSTIETAEDQVYMLVSRYDRKLIASKDGPRLQRLHQEDLCQALGYSPDFKYERDGGPNWKLCFELLDASARREYTTHRAMPRATRALDRPDLLNLAMFQWVVGNPDAHAKNYSLILTPDRASLAPAYDLNNAAAFRDMYKSVRPRMAMSIGGVFHPDELSGENWDQFARETGFSPSVVRQALSDMASRVPDLASTLASSMRGTPAWSDRIVDVVDDIAARCASVPGMLAGRQSKPKEDASGVLDLSEGPLS